MPGRSGVDRPEREDQRGPARSRRRWRARRASAWSSAGDRAGLVEEAIGCERVRPVGSTRLDRLERCERVERIGGGFDRRERDSARSRSPTAASAVTQAEGARRRVARNRGGEPVLQQRDACVVRWRCSCSRRHVTIAMPMAMAKRQQRHDNKRGFHACTFTLTDPSPARVLLTGV